MDVDNVCLLRLYSLDSSGELFIPCSYMPRNRIEHQFFEDLWQSLYLSAHRGGDGSDGGQSQPGVVGGSDAVAFFKSSGLDVETLQTIWKLSSPDDKLDRNQFYVSLRFISIAQQSSLLAVDSVLTPGTERWPQLKFISEPSLTMYCYVTLLCCCFITCFILIPVITLFIVYLHQSIST